MLILFVFLYFIFTGIQVNRLDDFSYYKELQADLDFYISTNILTNLFYFLIFAIIWVALLGFGSPILIFSGIIFGQWVGTIISVVSISIGSLVLFIIGNFFFRDLINEVLKNKFEKYIHLFKKMNFIIFLFMIHWWFRVPFGLQNLIQFYLE